MVKYALMVEWASDGKWAFYKPGSEYATIQEARVAKRLAPNFARPLKIVKMEAVE